MATENAASSGGNYPTEDEYLAETTDTRDVGLPASGFDFNVRTIPPLQVLMSLKRHGMSDLLDTEAVDDMDYAELLQNDQFISFMEETVVPNVQKPSVYLEDPSDGEFNLANLDPEDLSALIGGLMAADEADVDLDEGDELGDSFPE